MNSDKCAYCPAVTSVPGIGLSTAHKLMKEIVTNVSISTTPNREQYLYNLFNTDSSSLKVLLICIKGFHVKSCLHSKFCPHEGKTLTSPIHL